MTSNPPAFAPVPPGAEGPAIPDQGYLRQEIGDGLHLVTDGVYQMMFLATGDGVVAVDAPPALGRFILPAVAEVTSMPVTHVVYSHHHADHIGAASIYPEEAQRWAHRDTAVLLDRLHDKRRPSPTGIVDDSHVLTVGDQELRLDYRGPNHSPGNLFVYAPRQRTLMLIDVIFPGWVPFDSLAQSTDIPGWVDAHDHILGYDFDTFVGGHVSRLGTREDVTLQQEYLRDVRAAIEEERAGLDMQQVMQRASDPKNPWAFVETMNDLFTTAATNSVNAKWTGRLAGADVYTRSNVRAMASALHIDYGTLH
ncbi:MBL fold metallo-hydrolase [Paractinoplanes toevensis]|uniref:MBL fold metallo-hydrolase n=1 Tax=Paractinoplanes toevensis TaxID=571911 RepID=A0A919WA47_9ACTN|nr:MBL fold metallo-hydrolase [Actinoplanes toevensis]GIM96308.1 MBL fold metallo-hydrolase [Actinoplanes toevensis]